MTDRKKHKLLTPAEELDLVADYLAGVSAQKIAKRYKISLGSAHNAIRWFDAYCMATSPEWMREKVGGRPPKGAR